MSRTSFLAGIFVLSLIISIYCFVLYGADKIGTKDGECKTLSYKILPGQGCEDRLYNGYLEVSLLKVTDSYYILVGNRFISAETATSFLSRYPLNATFQCRYSEEPLTIEISSL